MPAVVIGPTVAIIGLALAGNAVGDMMTGDITDASGAVLTSPYVALVCALVTLFVVIICSTFGGKKLRLIPFIIGILAGYLVALVFTLLGDGVGSFVGAVFGGCPNTTYGESIGCVAITGNASVVSITAAAVLVILSAFVSPFVAFLDTIPACVMGGVCMTLYGFIAVSGLKMLQPVDLNENRNLFVASVILIAGVGGRSLDFVLSGGQTITITEVACALILGIVTNLILSGKKKGDKDEPQQLIK